ncbi:sulfurtransferase TusA family protein [Thermodesulfobacteriota bacterium]
MKFVENQKPDDTLDLVCRMCPLHLLEPGEKLKCLKKGQVLEVLTDYDGALEDIPDWCQKHGQEFVGIDEDEDYYKLYIKKKK